MSKILAAPYSGARNPPKAHERITWTFCFWSGVSPLWKDREGQVPQF